MKERFIPTNNDLSYYPLLYKALQETNHTRGSIVEMGCGHGSTPLLHDYAMRYKRNLFSYETEKEWIEKFEGTANEYHKFYLLCRECWNVCSNTNPNPAVVFIDHAPGERRKEDLLLFKNQADIIVIHDTEPTGAGDYRVRPLFIQFKYVVEVMSNAPNPHEAGAWATALSNKIDITKWIGEKFGNYKISEWQR